MYKLINSYGELYWSKYSKSEIIDWEETNESSKLHQVRSCTCHDSGSGTGSRGRSART